MAGGNKNTVMKKKFTYFILLLLAGSAFPGIAQQNSDSTLQTTEETIVYVFEIREQIAPPVWRKQKWR
ncbi:MAG: hypothetical protein U5L09_03465 [Bacteroidales bacterium]|nr:hypothetical protein [Bacteroidales bacterium]